MKLYRHHSPYLFLIVLAGLLNACGGSNSKVKAPSYAGELISVNKLSTHYKPEINSYLAQATTQVVALYNVDSYKMVYATLDPHGELITVSGLLSVPQKSQGANSPILNYQHGTIFLDSSAPTFNHSTLYSQSNAFNKMASRVEKLVHGHRDLTNAVSHELKTPLSHLRFALQMQQESKNKAYQEKYTQKIEDDGKGIDNHADENTKKSALDNLFQPFFRHDESRDRKSGGSGMGLAISKKIIERHGGTIEYQKSC